jgi:uncharacterized protein DUF5666
MFKGSIMFKTYYLVLLLTSMFLTACGGSSSSSSTPDVEPPTTPPPPVTTTTTETSGVITGFGSVFVNGVEYETTSTDVSTDDNDAASESDLQVGMIITLTGSVNDDGTTGTADAIHYEEQVKGPLDSIDLAANSLVILGQTVIFDELTTLDNLVLIDLAPGDFLEISGFMNADDQLYATRIEKETAVDTIKVEGDISMLDAVAKTFKLADLTVNYTNASFVNITEADLANDLAVRVKGDASALVDGVFTVTQIKAEQQEVQHSEGDNRQLEGVITTFDSSASFVVNDITVITDATTEYEHGTADSLALNVRVKIKGVFDANDNLLAKEIRIQQRTDLKLEGAIQAINLDLNTLAVLDVIFTVDDQTKMHDESDQGERFFSLADLTVGDFVEVKGFVDDSGNNIATKLERRNEDSNRDTELKGIVRDINTTDFNFTIVDVMIATTSTTLFEGTSGDNVDQQVFFEQLSDGMAVEVEGTVTDNIFTANIVKIEEQEDGGDDGDGNGDHDNGDRRTEFRGTIESLADTSFVVSGHTVNITENTEYEANDNELAADQFWALVKVGDQVKVKGTKNAEGIITAKQVSLEIEEQDNVAEVELKALGTYINNVLEVGEHTIEFDQNTDFKGLDNELSLDEFLAQVSQWQKFKVVGTLRENNIFARKIEQKELDEDGNTIELSAFIEAFIDNGLTVAGHHIQFTDDTVFSVGDNPLTLDEFLAQAVLNDRVMVNGALMFDTQSDQSLQEVINANEIELKMHN